MGTEHLAVLMTVWKVVERVKPEIATISLLQSRNYSASESPEFRDHVESTRKKGEKTLMEGNSGYYEGEEKEE